VRWPPRPHYHAVATPPSRCEGSPSARCARPIIDLQRTPSAPCARSRHRAAGDPPSALCARPIIELRRTPVSAVGTTPSSSCGGHVSGMCVTPHRAEDDTSARTTNDQEVAAATFSAMLRTCARRDDVSALTAPYRATPSRRRLRLRQRGIEAGQRAIAAQKRQGHIDRRRYGGAGHRDTHWLRDLPQARLQVGS